MKSLTFSCTNVWIVISSTHSSSCGCVGRRAVDQQVGDLEVGRVLAQLLDRVAAVLEDARVAVDVGDRAAARGRVHERRVVGHQPEVVLVDLDLAQVHRAHGAVGDRQLVGRARAVVGDRQRVLRGAVAAPPARARRGVAACLGRLGLGAHLLLLSTVPVLLRLDYASSGRDSASRAATVAARRRAGSALRQARARDERAHARRRRAAGSPCGPRRGGRGRRERGWCGWRGRGRGPMPPSSPVAGSGVWRTAQRTIRNSATIGIFSRNISQMKVQASTRVDRIPALAAHNPRRCAAAAAASAASAAQLQRRAAELRDRVQLVHARVDLLARQALRRARCRTPRR